MTEPSTDDTAESGGGGDTNGTAPSADDAAPLTERTAATTSADAPAVTTAPTATIRRERAAAGLGLGRGLAAAVVVAVALPAGAALWLAGTSGTADTAPAPTTPATTTAAVTAAPPAGAADLDRAALQRVIDGLETQATAAAEAAAAIAARADDAERGARLRAVQKQVALARDARRSAGQSGPALKGPFPVDELGDLAALGFGPGRWLTTREGAVLLPAATSSPVSLATSGRDEDAATFKATVAGVASSLLRRCVPFEPYCIVDVLPVSPAPPPPVVDLAPLRALAATLPATTTATVTTTTAAVAPATPTGTAAPSALARGFVVALALLGLVVGILVARRLQRLGVGLHEIAWRLQAGLAGRAGSRRDHAVAELNALEAAVDDALAAVARLAAVDDDTAWRRSRLEAAAALLLDAPRRGGLPRLDDDSRDDVGTARVIAATRALLDGLDARHRRLAMGLTELEGTVRLVTPLAQRLLQLARVDGLPAQAADELTSLGTSLGQRARRPQVLPGLLQDIAPLTPTNATIVDVAAAVEPLGADGARLAARQLEGAATEG